MIYFTADTHFDHYNIMKLMKRPWERLDEMNEGILANINKLSQSDDLYHLGDFAFKNGPIWAERIVPKLHLLIGNHDDKRMNQYKHLLASIHDVLYLRWEGHRFYLSHYAHRTWRNSHHGAYHLYGHSHGMLPDYGRSMDVGVDPLNFCPISIEDVVERLKDQPSTAHHPE